MSAASAAVERRQIGRRCPGPLRLREGDGRLAPPQPDGGELRERRAKLVAVLLRSALLGSWLVAAGCLRYRHLQVAEPRRISTTAFHGHCRRGKEARLRITGFDFAICARFSSSWSWTEASRQPTRERDSASTGRGGPGRFPRSTSVPRRLFARCCRSRRM